MAGTFDGYYYRKPWVQKPFPAASGDPFSIGYAENSQVAPDFAADAPLNPRDDIFDSPAKWSYNGPWASNMERLTQQALMAAAMPGAELQAMVRPPLPQVRLFPQREGFGNRLQPDINDIISLDRVYMEPRISWYSGSPAGYSGSSRNDLGSN